MRTCIYCSGPIPDTLRKGTKFCKRRCGEEYNSDLRSGVAAVRTCQCCGNEFSSRYGKKRFCSRECNSKFHNALRPPRAKGRTRKEYRGTCHTCGKEFVGHSEKRIFCSLQCLRAINEPKRRERYLATVAELAKAPEYSKAQLRDARHNKAMLEGDPSLIKGRELILEKANRIIQYWNERQRMEAWVERKRVLNRERMERYRQKKMRSCENNPCTLSPMGV